VTVDDFLARVKDEIARRALTLGEVA